MDDNAPRAVLHTRIWIGSWNLPLKEEKNTFSLFFFSSKTKSKVFLEILRNFPHLRRGGQGWNVLDQLMSESADSTDVIVDVSTADSQEPGALALCRRTLMSYPKRDNPLENTLIIENVIRFLAVQDLRVCRSVCNLWKKEVDRWLSKKQMIRLDRRCSNIENAEKLLIGVQGGKYVMVDELVFYEVFVSNILGRRLIRNFGSTLTSLSLLECNLTAVDLYRILHYARNIEELCFQQQISNPANRRQNLNFEHLLESPSTLSAIKCMDDTFQLVNLKRLRWFERYGSVCIYEIIHHFPNLVRCDLEQWRPPDVSDYEGLQWKSLRKLCMTPYINTNFLETHFKSLSKLNLSIEDLVLKGSVPWAGLEKEKFVESLRTFLNSVSSSLRILRIFEPCRYVNLPPEWIPIFPMSGICLPELKLLQIDRRLVNDLQCISEMSKLSTFHCELGSAIRWRQVLKNIRKQPLVNMKNLYAGVVDVKVLSSFGIIFPNLIFLEVHNDDFGDEELRTINQFFPKLEVLRIVRTTNRDYLPTDKQITDSGINYHVKVAKAGGWL